MEMNGERLEAPIEQFGDRGEQVRRPRNADLKYEADGLGIYLKDVSRYPLLTPEEVTELAKQIESGHNSVSLMDEAQHSLPKKLRVAHEENIKSAEAAKQKLITSNLRLVVAFVRRYHGTNLETLDLIQEGNIGLGRAAEKFDYRKGFQFSIMRLGGSDRP